MREDARGLAAAAEEAQRRGRRVFWRTSSPICFDPSYVTNWGMRTSEVNAMVQHSDAAVTSAVRARGVPAIDLRAIDLEVVCAGDRASEGKIQSSVTAASAVVDTANETAVTACRCRGYGMDSTHLHPAPQTARAQVTSMLRTAAASCPRGAHGPGVVS